MKADFPFPQAVRRILWTMEKAGFEAYAVGGCVRDVLLGAEPKDWDITTNARPQEVKALFRRTVDTGIKHGTVTVLLGGMQCEVTTYRVDGAYTDGRHPDSVTFSGSLGEDLARRDFTVNAMACGLEGKVVDLYGGMEDLEKRIIRCVGDPDARFDEDALRILRAVRFAACLGFDTEPSTEKAIRSHAGDLKKISAERICAELLKLLLSGRPKDASRLHELKLDRFIFADWDSIDWTCQRLSPSLPDTPSMRLAAFLFGMEPGKAQKLLRDLKLDNETIAHVKAVLGACRKPLPDTEEMTRRCMAELEPCEWDMRLLLAEGTDKAEKAKELTAKIRDRKDPISLKDMAVGGRDLLDEGFAPGKELGETLKLLLSAVLHDPRKNDREELLRLARNQRNPLDKAKSV